MFRIRKQSLEKQPVQTNPQPPICPAQVKPALKTFSNAANLFNSGLDQSYFVSLYTHNRKCLFGEIMDNQMILNAAGNKIQDAWYELPVRFPAILLDLFSIMPNHLHGLLLFSNSCTPSSELKSQPATTAQPIPINGILREFLFSTTQLLSESAPDWKNPLWRTSYELEAISTPARLEQLRDFIADNPLLWATDPINPVSQPAINTRPVLPLHN